MKGRLVSPTKDLTSADQLVTAMKAYDSHVQEALIKQAYAFSMKAHEKQQRDSGEPYFIHPLAVAEILISMRLDSASIVTALLHDTVEDTLTTADEIHRLFGKEIAFLVDGVTKLTHAEVLSDQAKQTEQFRKLLLAMSSDIRVLLVKLADRTHNMRTLNFVSSEEKRQRIARETIDIYAPLAERMGLRSMKEELEDLSFAELNPDARLSVLSRLKFLRMQETDLMATISKGIQELLDKQHIKALVVGREKTPYSIWQKMQRKNLSFEQLSDIVAFRVLVENIPTCYQVLGILHSHYAIVPGRFKDYISLPRNTHYQSLHTTFIGPLKRQIEIQIRTHEMEYKADLGVAAHWQYKQGFHPGKNHYLWIRELLDLLEHAENPEEFLEHTKLEMFPDQVFCFTPKGNLITLPRGATAVDFAYAVHSRVGNTCVGVKINGRLLPLYTKINNGDQVEILTSSLQTPSLSWERHVTTAKARTHIRRFLKQKQEKDWVQIGHDLLEKTFQEGGVTFSVNLLEPHVHAFGCETAQQILKKAGQGHIHPHALFYQLFPQKDLNLQETAGALHPSVPPALNSPIQGGFSNASIHYATCCHPLPGDSIVGVMVVGQGLTIHTKNCAHLKSYPPDKQRLDMAWKTTSAEKHIGRLVLTIVNQPGSIATLTTLLAKSGAHILNLKTQDRHPDFFGLILDLEVQDVQQLNEMIALLRMSSWVLAVERDTGKDPPNTQEACKISRSKKTWQK